MTPEELQVLSRTELQELAKEHGIKANLKSAKLVAELTAKLCTAAAPVESAQAEPPAAVEPEPMAEETPEVAMEEATSVEVKSAIESAVVAQDVEVMADEVPAESTAPILEEEKPADVANVTVPEPAEEPAAVEAPCEMDASTEAEPVDVADADTAEPMAEEPPAATALNEWAAASTAAPTSVETAPVEAPAPAPQPVETSAPAPAPAPVQAPASAPSPVPAPAPAVSLWCTAAANIAAQPKSAPVADPSKMRKPNPSVLPRVANLGKQARKPLQHGSSAERFGGYGSQYKVPEGPSAVAYADAKMKSTNTGAAPSIQGAYLSLIHI